MEGDERLSLPNPFTLPSFSFEKWHYMSLFDPERWYGELEDFTFATAFMPLSKAQATALVHHYQKHMLRHKDALTHEDESQLAQLEMAIDQEMEQLRQAQPPSSDEGGLGFFVRLSSRSPKDAGLNEGHPHILEYLKEETDKFGGVTEADPNQKTIALQRAAGRILRVTDAKQAIWLIVNSERTYSDLVHALGHENEEWTMKIVIRHWLNGIDLANEFRGFVCAGRLTALSQYNDGNYYHELMGQEEVIVRRIREYWEKVKPHVKYQACIVDFVLVNDMKDVYVVEINPFGPVTGGALFDWRTERRLIQGNVDVWGDLDECPSRSSIDEDGEADRRYTEYRAPSDDDAEHQAPVLRLVHKVPPYLNEDYLMGFPILAQVAQLVAAKEEQAAAPLRSTSQQPKRTCSLQ